MSLNKVMLIGNVGKEPVIRYVEAGVCTAAFPLATTTRGYTLPGGTQVPERTEWHNILMWRGLAETVEKYVHKGDKLYIEGEIRTRNWTDKKGTVHYITEVWAKEMEMLTPKGARPADNAPQQQESAPGANNAEMTTGATADTSTGLPF
ncbi:MAG: single-stranded DNA-binding protein [Alloprevotella sp.]|nr:single-stranded DNA-binding protein [Alloprevotella sp.]